MLGFYASNTVDHRSVVGEEHEPLSRDHAVVHPADTVDAEEPIAGNGADDNADLVEVR